MGRCDHESGRKRCPNLSNGLETPLRWTYFAQCSGSGPAVLCVGSYPTPGRARAGRTEAYARPAGDALGNIGASAGIWTARPFGSWCGGAEGLHPRSEARSHWSMASLAFESEISRAGQIMTTKSSCSQMTRHASLQLSDIPEGPGRRRESITFQYGSRSFSRHILWS